MIQQVATTQETLKNQVFVSNILHYLPKFARRAPNEAKGALT